MKGHINHYFMLKSAFIFNREMWLHFWLKHKINIKVSWIQESVTYILWPCSYCSVPGMLLTFKGMLVSPKWCMDVNSIEIISNLSKGKDKDLESWLWMASWDLYRPFLFFCPWTSEYFTTSSLFHPQSFITGFSLHGFTSLSCSQPMWMHSFFCLFPVFPAIH